MHVNKFKPKLGVDVESQHQNKQNKSKTFYDKTAKQRPEFEPNQMVLFRNNNKWHSGKIINKHETPRSYIIEQSDGRLFRRNTRHVRRLLPSETQQIQDKQNIQTQPPTNMQQKLARSGRQY